MDGAITAPTRPEALHRAGGAIAANLQPVAAMAALPVIIPVLRMMTAATGAITTAEAVPPMILLTKKAFTPHQPHCNTFLMRQKPNA